METKTTELIDKVEVIRCIKSIFGQEHETLKRRSPEVQTLIGNLLTVTELEVKKCIKELTVTYK